MLTETRAFPSMPEVGHPESYYAHRVHHAERHGDVHLREASKAGQYITLALNPHLAWEEKVKYFRHAIERHCQPPPFPDEDVWMFYHRLSNHVRQYAGQEALRLACEEDELYAARLAMGQDREKIEDDAEIFFQRFIPEHDQCPEWFNEEDFAQLKMIRDQWI